MDCNAGNSGMEPENDPEFDPGKRWSGEIHSQAGVPIIGLPHSLALMASQLLSQNRGYGNQSGNNEFVLESNCRLHQWDGQTTTPIDLWPMVCSLLWHSREH
jgi:hypothetical protein